MKMKVTAPLLLALVLAVAPGLARADDTTLDFSPFGTGEKLSDLGNGVTIEAWKRPYNPRPRSNGSLRPWQPMVSATAMIFNSSSPTGGDEDLGTPNEDFGGPGIGIKGKEGSPVENRYPLGNVVIISEDDDSSDPDDEGNGGSLIFNFPAPVNLKEVGLLDNEEGTIFTATLNSNETVTEVAGQGGDNSYEAIVFGDSSMLKGVKQLNITMGGSGAITHITTTPFETGDPKSGNKTRAGGDPVSENRWSLLAELHGIIWSLLCSPIHLFFSMHSISRLGPASSLTTTENAILYWSTIPPLPMDWGCACTSVQPVSNTTHTLNALHFKLAPTSLNLPMIWTSGC